jgi:carbon storage regulator
MLVLSRKRGEELIIGDVVVTVLEMHGERVKLGFVAPAEVPIHRTENMKPVSALCERVPAH